MTRLFKKVIISKIIFIAWLISWIVAFAYLWFLNRASEMFWGQTFPALVVGLTVTIFTFWLTLNYEKDASDIFWKKIYPAVVAGIMGATFTLWVGLKDEKIEIQFPATLIYHIESGKALEECDEKYDSFYGSKFFQIRRYIKNPMKNHDFYSYRRSKDIFFLEVLTLLFTSPPEEPVDPLMHYLIHKTEDPSLQHFPEQTLTWEKFTSKYLKKYCGPEINKLYSQIEDPNLFELLEIREMCLPKGTEIKFAFDVTVKGINFKNAIRSIGFKNDFCEVRITIFRDEGSRGLGEWKWILEYDDDKADEYWTSRQKVYLFAKFNRFRSGHPDMPKYKEWVNSMFDRLHSCLDSEQQLKMARERHHLYRDDINNYFKSLELRRKDKLQKTSADVNENQTTNKQAAGNNQPVK